MGANKTDKESDKTTVKMDKELVQRAHDVGLNVSKTCSIALETAIEALEGVSKKKSSNRAR